MEGHGNMPAFAKDSPRTLWLASERHERKNGAPYKAYTFSLPKVQSVEQNKALAWKLVHALAGPKPFQLAMHVSYSSLSGEPNPHVHAMICDRVPDGIDRPAEQMFKRHDPVHPERGGCRKDSGGKTPLEMRDHVLTLRRTLADITNAELERNGYTDRVDYRSLKQQGRSRKPERYLGPARIRTMSAEEKKQYVSARRGNL